MSETEPAAGRVVVRDQPVVDFSHLTSPDQLAGISRIEDVAVVVVPQSLAGAYAAIPTADVAGTVYVPDGANTRLHSGAMVVGGDGLGGADDVLVIIGMLVITSPVTSPVPQRIYVIGSVLAPRGSEGLLGPALAGGSGSVSYYPHQDDQDVRVLSGQVRLSGAMLANPAGQAGDILIAAGQVAVTDEVTTLGYRLVVVAGQLAAPARRVLVGGFLGWFRRADDRQHPSGPEGRLSLGSARGGAVSGARRSARGAGAWPGPARGRQDGRCTARRAGARSRAGSSGPARPGR